MSRAKWDEVQIFGFVDERAKVQLIAKPPKSWLDKLIEDLMPWVYMLFGGFIGWIFGAIWAYSLNNG